MALHANLRSRAGVGERRDRIAGKRAGQGEVERDEEVVDQQ